MTDVYLTDDQELAERLTAQATAALALADMIDGDTVERAGALIAAASVLIEREVGRTMAPNALMTLINPTLADWQSRRPGEAVQ